jgi:Orsellinic acid/F9775 biosynthesis cluster protein D
MSVHSYITHVPTFRVVVCDFCEVCIPPKDPLRHYEDHHTAKKDHPVPMEMRRKIADYMRTLDLCQSGEVIPHGLMPELKVIKEGFMCNFQGCDACALTESSMRTHYYTHQKHIPKGFKDWKSTSIQTFFEGHHKKYDK